MQVAIAWSRHLKYKSVLLIQVAAVLFLYITSIFRKRYLLLHIFMKICFLTSGIPERITAAQVPYIWSSWNNYCSTVAAVS